MASLCANSMTEALQRHQLLEPDQFVELDALLQRTSDPRELAREMIRRGWLTPYQVNQLILGRARELTLGKYILVERLGEGGMGQVYKARQKHLQRTVAIKVIRKDFLGNHRAVARFQREIQLAAQLSHANIVHAYDAGLVGETYYFAMEFLDGTRLDRMVKQSGPLPLEQACNYIRQSALGLQHAHERGMVHRDIKPGNLIVVRSPGSGNGRAKSGILRRPDAGPAPWGIVKILDLGLARGQATDATVSKLTQIGSLMGTPDYISPEQIRSSRDCDIRSDIYALGCTFYFLLAGQSPFPKGSVTDKLHQQQFAEPQPVEAVRREVLLSGLPAGQAELMRSLVDVPEKVAGLVRRLMAKNPGDRPQTPGELATALS